MLVFWKERLVLLAVPKTGTTALEGALAPRASVVMRDPPTVKHAPLYRYRRFVEPLLKASGGEGFETVAVVREPVGVVVELVPVSSPRGHCRTSQQHAGHKL